MSRILSLFLALVCLFSSVFGGSAGKPFKNDYSIPESLAPYKRLDTEPKTDWTANYIWDNSEGSEENVWMCFRKSVNLQAVPETVTAYISADSKYWLYINGKTVVFDGGVKRGPTEADSYFDTVELAPYLKAGKNTVCALVWYWGKDKNFSYTDSGRGGFLFEAGDVKSDKSWKVSRNTAYQKEPSLSKANYRLPEFGICYDASQEIGDWLSPEFDDSAWENATECGKGGDSPWGKLYPRGIPMLKDYGLKDYENSKEFAGLTVNSKTVIALNIPYNTQCTPYLKIDAPAGKKIRIFTENTWLGAVSDTYITKDGEQEFEALGWFNGEHISYQIPSGVKIIELKYRESGYDTAFCGTFECSNDKLNTLWQKSLRTLYVTMRDNFMDCPDRERAQWWGDVTNEMAMSMYALDSNAYLLYQKGVASMLGHIDKSTDVLQTVVPIGGETFELPVQQLAGICGFWTYYLYTGDTDFLKSVYDASVNYVNLWTIGENGLVSHREGSWDWMDWGSKADVTAIENAWYYYALSCIKNMAEALGKASGDVVSKMSKIEAGYASLWTENGYKSEDVKSPDDRANALAVLSGLADAEQYGVITSVLTETKNASPYMEYYVLEALCRMEQYEAARKRMLERYGAMINYNYSTLWEKWNPATGTQNHAWSGGGLIIMSKYLAGVRPLKAGYSEYLISPQLSEEENISCRVPSVRGYISVAAKKSEGLFALDATVPEGAKAVISLPYSKGKTVKLNGTPVYKNGGLTVSSKLTLEEANNERLTFSVTPNEKETLRFEVCD